MLLADSRLRAGYLQTVLCDVVPVSKGKILNLFVSFQIFFIQDLGEVNEG